MKNVYSVTRFLFSFIFIILLNGFFSFDGRTASFSSTADPTMPVTDGMVYSSVIDEDGITYLVGEFNFVGPVEALTGSGVLIDAETGKISNRPFPRVEGNIREVISDSKGGWFIFGDFGTVGDLPRNSFAHILPSGLVDPNWDLKDDKIQLINIFFNKEDNRLYAVDVYNNKNNFIVINGENGRKIDWKPAIPDGAIFHRIAAGRSGIYIKYLLQGKTKVAHLDSQGKVLWDVELSYEIHKMILSPDENKLFMITHGNSDSLSAMNTSNGTIDPKIGFYVRPSLEDVFIDPDKKFLYLVGKISEIEQISTQKKISGLKQVAIVNIDTTSAQYGSADESRNININHPADDIRFIHFNPINKKGYGRGFGGPSGLFVLSTSDYNNDKFITKLDLDSPIINKVFVAGDPSFDINPDGKTLYIGGYFLTNQQNQKYLAAIDPQGKLISTFKPELDPRCSPKRVTVIHHPQKGKIVVAAGLPSDSNVCLQGFEKSGKMVFSSQSKQLTLSSLTASSDLSRLYLSGYENLEIYDTEGNLLMKDWGQIPFDAWTEGKEGSIYIIGMDQNNVLQLNIFDKSGKLQKNLSGPQLTDGYPTQLLLSPSGEEAYVTLSVHTLLKLNLKDGVLTRDTNFNLGDIEFTQIYSSGKEEYSIFASQNTSDLKLINLNKNGGSGPVESFDLPTSAGGYFNLFSSVNSYNVSKSSVDVTGNFLRIRDEYRPGFARFTLKGMTEESPSKNEGSSGSGGGCALIAKTVHLPFEKSALVAFFLISLVFLTSVRIIQRKRSLSR